MNELMYWIMPRKLCSSLVISFWLRLQLFLGLILFQWACISFQKSDILSLWWHISQNSVSYMSSLLFPLPHEGGGHGLLYLCYRLVCCLQFTQYLYIFCRFHLSFVGRCLDSLWGQKVIIVLVKCGEEGRFLIQLNIPISPLGIKAC